MHERIGIEKMKKLVNLKEFGGKEYLRFVINLSKRFFTEKEFSYTPNKEDSNIAVVIQFEEENDAIRGFNSNIIKSGFMILKTPNGIASNGCIKFSNDCTTYLFAFYPDSIGVSIISNVISESRGLFIYLKDPSSMIDKLQEIFIEDNFENIDFITCF